MSWQASPKELLAKLDDRRGFREVQDALRPHVEATVRRLLRLHGSGYLDRAAADDLVQQVLGRLLVGREVAAFDPARGTLAAYAVVFTASRVKEALRKELHRDALAPLTSLDEALDVACEAPSPEQAVALAEYASYVQRAAQLYLPGPLLVLFRYFVQQGLSYEVLEVESGLTRARLYTLVSELKQRLEKIERAYDSGLPVEAIPMPRAVEKDRKKTREAEIALRQLGRLLEEV